MKPWTEENYLERLMPQLRQAKRVNMESCPDSELLVAYTEDQVDSFVRGAITAHLAKCQDCAELCSRLENFSRATVPDQDREWANVEKRLENWGESFLKSKAAANPAAQAEPARVLGWKETPKAGFSWWKFASFAGAMAVVLVVGGFILERKGALDALFRPSPPVQVAQQQPPPNPVVPQAQTPSTEQSPSTQQSPAAASATPETTAQTPQTDVGVKKPPVIVTPNAAATKSTKTTPLHKAPPPVESSGNPQLASAPPDERPATSSTESHPAAPTSNSAGTSSQGGQNQVAQSYTPTDIDPNARIVTTGSNAAAASHPATFNGAASAPPNTKAAHATAVPPPASIRLDAGTRLWIHVNSTDRQADGNFTFHGSLIQPATNAVTSKALDPGTEVSGSGLVKGGKVTLLKVSNFAISGVSYSLPGAAGAISEQSPGSGKAVEFQNGTVLEMWVSQATSYPKVSGETK